MPTTPDMFAIRQQSPVYCVYHRADFDGQCSAAIVIRNTVDCTPIGYVYGEPFPWHIFEQANRHPICYMVDMSLPIADMKRLTGLCDLVWIDHHASKIAEALAADFNPPGIRDSLFAACELTWGWFHGNMANIPLAVHLLGRWDVWDHKDARVLPFQYYMRSYQESGPENTALWNLVFDWDPVVIGRYCIVGSDIRAYKQVENYQNSTAYGFLTKMFGYPTLACNIPRPSSAFFEGDPRAANAVIWCAFYWRHLIGWTISLYTNDPTVDVGDIARRMGGGGHKGAAGYTVNILPEELQQRRTLQ